MKRQQKKIDNLDINVEFCETVEIPTLQVEVNDLEKKNKKLRTTIGELEKQLRENL